MAGFRAREEYTVRTYGIANTKTADFLFSSNQGKRRQRTVWIYSGKANAEIAGSPGHSRVVNMERPNCPDL